MKKQKKLNPKATVLVIKLMISGVFRLSLVVVTSDAIIKIMQICGAYNLNKHVNKVIKTEPAISMIRNLMDVLLLSNLSYI